MNSPLESFMDELKKLTTDLNKNIKGIQSFMKSQVLVNDCARDRLDSLEHFEISTNEINNLYLKDICNLKDSIEGLEYLAENFKESFVDEAVRDCVNDEFDRMREHNLYEEFVKDTLDRIIKKEEANPINGLYLKGKKESDDLLKEAYEEAYKKVNEGFSPEQIKEGMAKTYDIYCPLCGSVNGGRDGGAHEAKEASNAILQKALDQAVTKECPYAQVDDDGTMVKIKRKCEIFTNPVKDAFFATPGIEKILRDQIIDILDRLVDVENKIKGMPFSTRHSNRRIEDDE